MFFNLDKLPSGLHSKAAVLHTAPFLWKKNWKNKTFPVSFRNAAVQLKLHLVDVLLVVIFLEE